MARPETSEKGRRLILIRNEQVSRLHDENLAEAAEAITSFILARTTPERFSANDLASQVTREVERADALGLKTKLGIFQFVSIALCSDDEAQTALRHGWMRRFLSDALIEPDHLIATLYLVLLNQGRIGI